MVVKPNYVEISTIVHATENQDKVIVALRNTLPQAIGPEMRFKKSHYRGHHGNQITMFKSSARGMLVESVLKYILLKLQTPDKHLLNSELSKHLDGDGNLFYIRDS